MNKIILMQIQTQIIRMMNPAKLKTKKIEYSNKTKYLNKLYLNKLLETFNYSSNHLIGLWQIKI